MPDAAQDIAPSAAAHLREIMAMKSQAQAMALELQARAYEIKSADHERRITQNTSDISRVLWVGVGLSMAFSFLVTLTMLTVSILSIWLAFRK